MAACCSCRNYSRKVIANENSDKYDVLRFAVKALESIGFRLTKIRTDGDSSVHDGIISCNMQFSSIEDFVHTDCRIGDYMSAGDYDASWTKTFFDFENDNYYCAKDINKVRLVSYHNSNYNMDCIVDIRYRYDTDLMSDDEVDKATDKIADNVFDDLAAVLNFE